MNDEQLCDFYLRAKEANLTLEKIANSLESVTDDGFPTGIVNPLLYVANALEAIDDKICETNDKFEETNERLETIGKSLAEIANALGRIATTYSDAEKKWGNLTSLTIKPDPSDGPFCSQESEESEGFADMA